MRKLIAGVTLFCTSAFAFQGTSPAPLRGYTPEHSTAEASWEQKFRAIPDQARLKENMRRLTARPHHVGSPYDSPIIMAGDNYEPRCGEHFVLPGKPH